ncbi:MAG: tetratricopeptide repeat protein [Desulfobulbaceae bacterium]|nr:tetratricopeptide repeat protein [Desulfobulbaceae bacterium]
MRNTARQIENQDSARIVGHVQLENKSEPAVRKSGNAESEAEEQFYSILANPSLSTERFQRELERVLAEMDELQSGNRWEDMIALFYPVAEKLPELVETGLDSPVRLKVGFALCRARRHEEAIACILDVVRCESNHVMANYSLANWEKQSPEEQMTRHQQRPKYIKSLYHLASCLLQLDLPRRSLKILEKMMKLDQDRNHMHPVFKHFAMGKVFFALGRPKEAVDHLETAAHRADNGQATDFIWELAARCALDLGVPDRAAGYIIRIPQSARRPYVRWTESDVLVAQGRKTEAVRILTHAAERDRRGRHKALLRLARIHLTDGEAGKALALAKQAADFCRETFGNEAHEAVFWQAACLYRLDRHQEALSMVRELEQSNFRYPHFSRLAAMVRDAVSGNSGRARDKVPFTLIK